MQTTHHCLRKLSVLTTALVETSLVTSVKAFDFFNGSPLNTALLIIIIIAAVVIIVLAAILAYLYYKRQMAEAADVKSGFAAARARMQEKKNQETGLENPEEKEEIEVTPGATPGELNTPGNDADEIHLAQLAADKERIQREQNYSKMYENENLNQKTETFGAQLKDKQFGQKLVETDIVAQMHDDKVNPTPGYTPGWTPGNENYIGSK